MTGQWLFLRPLDRVYFGPPISLVAGEASSGRSEFPPSPFAVAGMVRTRLLEGAEPKLDLDDWSSAARDQRAGLVGTAADLPSDWQLLGPFPACEVEDEAPSPRLEPWLPMPAWVKLGRDDGRLHPPSFLAHRSAVGRIEPPPSPGRFLADDDGEFDPQGCWLGTPALAGHERTPGCVPASLLARLLRDGRPVDTSAEAWLTPWKSRWSPEVSSVSLPPFVQWEQAPGVAIDAVSRTARDGMLYTLQMLRFAPGSGFVVFVNAPLRQPLRAESLTSGVVRAGRKGQVAAFEPVGGRLEASWDDLMDVQHLTEQGDDATFWIYLGTPARMRRPYRDVIDSLRERAPAEMDLSILAVAMAEPQIIGGLAIDGGRPRDNAPYARAGSAWLVRLEGATPAGRSDFLQGVHGHCVLGPKAERAFGFGFTLVGRGPRIPRYATSTHSTPSTEERTSQP